MVQEADTNGVDPVISNLVTTTVATKGNDNAPDDKNYNPHDDNPSSYPSDTVAAVTIAVLAVVIIVTMLIVFRALRKRQRARQGERFGENVIPTITTGVMGSGGAAYAQQSVHNSVPVRGGVHWESIDPATGDLTRNTTYSHNHR